MTALEVKNAFNKLSFYGRIWDPWTPEDRYRFLTHFWQRLEVIVRPNGDPEGEISVYIHDFFGKLVRYGTYYHATEKWVLEWDDPEIDEARDLHWSASEDAFELNEKYWDVPPRPGIRGLTIITPDHPHGEPHGQHRRGMTSQNDVNEPSA